LRANSSASSRLVTHRVGRALPTPTIRERIAAAPDPLFSVVLEAPDAAGLLLELLAMGCNFHLRITGRLPPGVSTVGRSGVRHTGRDA
jgi:hypothetical protein